ncbi:MAG: Gfo/Idh/MocA family oxidoreductase, partial [Lentisphaeria bacterium]|nr:Gfo/Idh/MocA family oxidoreductase [Lentisphaeria bacterium]
MSTIKVGVVGIGGTGKMHARQYAANPRAQLVAVCARAADELEKFARELHVPKVYTDYREMADDSDIQAVSVCTPTALHFPMVKLMLDQGKHVLVEKPMGVNAAECQEMIDAADKHKLKLQVGNMWRFHPEVQFIKSVVDAGRIGRIVKAKSYGIHVNWGPGRWFIDKELAGGGILVDMGIHAINTMRLMLGDAAARSVYAKTDTLYGTYDVDDFCVLMIEFENGA